MPNGRPLTAGGYIDDDGTDAVGDTKKEEPEIIEVDYIIDICDFLPYMYPAVLLLFMILMHLAFESM